MHGIDLPTLVIVVSFLALLLAGVLAAMWLRSRNEVEGIGLWAASIPLMVLSTPLFLLQESHPIIHVVLANAALLSGVVVMNAGMLRFYGLATPRPASALSGVLAIIGLLAWYTLVQPHFILRLTTMSLLYTVLFGLMCWIPLRHGRGSLGSLISAFAFSLTSISCLLRLVSVIGNLDRPADMLDPGILQAVYLGSYMVSVLLGSIGFILLLNERLRDIIEFNGSHDALTGVLNRGAFFARARSMFDESRRLDRPLSVALLDLDNFKQINDGYGHAVGDHVLTDFCQAVRRTLRPTDIMGRYGGEEFVLLLPDLAREGSAALAQRVRAALSPSAELPAYTASIGVATLGPDTADIDELLNDADKALYRAKSKGRDRVEVWP